ncbi:MAG: TIGR00341 family protein [Haloarculaceae archaeon]
MRLVQVTIPSGKRETALSALDDEGVDYVVADETSSREYAAIAYFPLPKNAVEPVLAALREAGLDDEAFTVVVEANTVVSRRFEALQEEYAEEEDEDRIAREELTAAADSLAPSTRTYVIMTVVSALIATAGLLLDSPAVVVGSMVIAPLVGPAMAASVGTVVNDQDLFSRGVRLQIGGLLLAVATAAAFAVLVRYTNLVPPLADITTIPEIRERVAPDFLSLVVALGAGAAGVVSLTSGVSTALVGVMIAVALIPPAATVGIGLAWGAPLVSLGSGVLLLVNVLSINLAALVVLWYTGYRPEHWFREGDARSATLKRVAVLAVSIAVLSAFLGGVTYDSYVTATTDENINEGVAEAVAAADTSAEFDVELLEVEVEHTNTILFQRPRTVVVTVGVPPGETFSGLSGRIDERVDAAAGRDVRTEVRYLASETA